MMETMTLTADKDDKKVRQAQRAHYCIVCTQEKITKEEIAREEEDFRQRQQLFEKKEAMQKKAQRRELDLIRPQAVEQTRTFSAPDVFENVGDGEGAIFNSNEVIMSEPALSRINEPFEPQRHSHMMIEEENRGSTMFTGLINSSVKFHDEQENAEEDASDRDVIYDQARQNMPESHVNHRQASH